MSIGINHQINRPISFSKRDRGNQQCPECQTPIKKGPHDKILKPAVLLSAMAGVGIAVSGIAKRNGINLIKDNKFADILKPHKWKIAKSELGPLDIIKLASGSVGGGLIAGIALDKENAKAKLREGFQQMLGNIIIPIACVTAGVKGYNSIKHKIKMPEVKSSKMLTKIIKAAPPAFAALGALATGILFGNWIANKLSHRIFHVTDKRKIEPGDFSGHIDDMCLAVMLVNPASNIGHIAGNIIPIALLVSGFESGTKKHCCKAEPTS